MTNNTTIKFLAVATLSLSALGTAAVLPASHADAASITQTSGNESFGKIEAITNTFKTFDSAENFAFGELPKILKGHSYDSHVFPAAKTGYNVSATIDYGEVNSKASVDKVANKLVQAADTAKPAEPNKPADNVVTPAEPNKPADNTVTPAEPNKPADNVVTPEKPNKPAEDTAKPADNTVTPADTAKPAEQTKPVDGSAQADTTKPATDLVKPDKLGEQPAKPTEKPTDKPTDKPADKPTDKLADKPTDKPTDKLIDKKEIAKTEKINKDTNTTETQKDVGKEVLPNTGESFSNSVLLGSILALFGLAITYKLKLSKK